MAERDTAKRDAPLANVSRRLVQLHKEYYGKGPTKAKTYLHDDLVVVILRGGFTRVEETLLREGRGDAVIEQRMEFQEVMRERFTEVIQEELGREVVAFMSGSHQDPDLIAEVFVLDPTEMTHDERQGRTSAGGTADPGAVGPSSVVIDADQDA
ncbi:MAG TPA: DUF2294 domain-containing protein [Thermoleophilaceae bacterium]|jgi:uncharacterized protein YbcI